jgi:AcrR family transcriptional regulator
MAPGRRLVRGYPERVDDRPLRADARRNREAILEAARQVFRERGLSAPLEEVAARAGVGTATLYRRFPAKADLVEAAFEAELRAYVAAVERGLADPDPWAGFVSAIMEICRMQAADRALADLVTMVPPRAGALRATAERGSALIHRLVARAQASGGLRPDFTPQDVVLLLMANAGVVHRMASEAPDGALRPVAFMVDGLRAAAGDDAVPEAPSESAVLRAMGRL